jgi:hypothetical protein
MFIILKKRFCIDTVIIYEDDNLSNISNLSYCGSKQQQQQQQQQESRRRRSDPPDKGFSVIHTRTK